MKFGIFYEISVPRPWDRETEKRVFDNCLEQVALADELGFDSVWCVEHHFLEEYSHCSAPEIFLTACAMKTKKIRVGHGIVICVPEFNHPIKIAERTATMDIISGGRLEVGTGRSATWNELGGFRANPDETKKTWDEFVRCLPKMWTQERFGYQGRSWSMPVRAIIPNPYQKRHPPMWVAVTSPGTEIDAAEGGNKVGRRLLGTFNFLAAQLSAARELYPSRSYPSVGLLPALRDQASGPADEAGVPEGIAIGNPERVLHACKMWESVGVDRVNFLMNALETVPQEQVLNSLRVFAKHVIPHFQETTAQAAAAGGGR